MPAVKTVTDISLLKAGDTVYTIVLADKDREFVESTAKSLRINCPRAVIVKMYGDGDKALEFIRKKHDGIAVINADLYGTDGVEILKTICSDRLETSVMLVSDNEDFKVAKAAVDFKAEQLYIKPISAVQLVASVKKAEKKMAEKVQQAYDDAERYLIEWEWKRQNLSLVYNGIFPLELAVRKGKFFWNDRLLTECNCFVAEFDFALAEEQIKKRFGKSEEDFYDAVIGLGEEENSKFAAYQVASSKEKIAYVVLSEQKYRQRIEKFADDLVQSLQSLYSIKTACKITYYPGIEEVLRFNSAKKISAKYLKAVSAGEPDKAGNIAKNAELSADDKTATAIVKSMLALLAADYDITYPDISKKVGLWADNSDIHMLMRELFRRVDADISSSRQLIVNIKYYINRNFSGGISVDSIAQNFGMNASYLGRLFKSETGEKLIDYIFSVRMDNAKRLLADTDMTVREVAISVGYSQIKYFGAVFKEHTGRTPSDYRRANRRNSQN